MIKCLQLLPNLSGTTYGALNIRNRLVSQRFGSVDFLVRASFNAQWLFGNYGLSIVNQFFINDSAINDSAVNGLGINGLAINDLAINSLAIKICK